MVWPRLTFVIGKGGAGKSTVSAALAVYLASAKTTLLADLDQRGSAARLLQTTPSDGEPVRAGQRLEICRLSAQRELTRFVERIVPVRTISRRMLGSRTFGYVTAALPGLEAFLLLTRLSAMAGEAARDDRYMVVDGLSTGASLELLSVALGVQNLAGAGTLNRLALELEHFIADPNRFGVAIVTGPEELALKEGLQAAAQLRAQLQVGFVIAIVNGCARPLFTKIEAQQVSKLDEQHGRLVRRRMELHAAARRAHSGFHAAGLDVIELPLLFTAMIGPPEVALLGRAFAHQVEL